MTRLTGSVVFGLACCLASAAPNETTPVAPDHLLLKDYKPHSIYKVPQTKVERARFPVIDVHAHDYTQGDGGVDQLVQTMDKRGVEKAIILSGATGKRLDQTIAKYSRYPDRFEVWCGLNLTGFDQPGFGPTALAELERCHKAGAKGVGEAIDKGRGLWFPCAGTLHPESNYVAMHPDDPRMDAIYEKCADLGMPVSIHVAEDQWMYEPVDASSDGLMNGWNWRVSNEPAVVQHDEMIDTLERAASKHPRTLFIACHLANCCADLNRLGALFDHCPNVYADMAARFGEIAPIPRFASRFIQRYQDRIMYATDGAGVGDTNSFRLLESADEHFYPTTQYHWAWYGLALPDETLKKIYGENARKVLSNGTAGR